MGGDDDLVRRPMDLMNYFIQACMHAGTTRLEIRFGIVAFHGNPRFATHRRARIPGELKRAGDGSKLFGWMAASAGLYPCAHVD